MKIRILLILLLLLSPALSYAGVRMAKTGVQYILNFELFEVDGVDFRIDAADGGGDSFIRKDQGAVTVATNDFVDEGNTYSLTITGAEMQAKEVLIQFIDQSGTKVWLDTAFLIQTVGSSTAILAFDLDTASVAQSADNDTKISTLITGVDLNADAITSAKIADNAIATEHIATAAITADSIATDAIGAAELAANAIGASELAADSITSSELAATAATKITDDWETQSQADPTGFHINVLEWTGTAVTLGSGAPDVNVQSEDNIDFGATKKASINTEVDNALDTILPGSPTTGSINDILDIQEEGVVTGAAAAGTLSTTEMTTDLTVSAADQFNGRIITFRKDTTTAELRGQQTDITATTVAGAKLGFTALTTAPVNGDIFEIN